MLHAAEHVHDSGSQWYAAKQKSLCRVVFGFVVHKSTGWSDGCVTFSDYAPRQWMTLHSQRHTKHLYPTTMVKHRHLNTHIDDLFNTFGHTHTLTNVQSSFVRSRCTVLHSHFRANRCRRVILLIACLRPQSFSYLCAPLPRAGAFSHARFVWDALSRKR